MHQPDDLHEWVSFEDAEEDRTWVFDVTFLTSSWTCIFGRGCKGVLTEDYSHAAEGCCSYGAHFTGDEDVARTEAMAQRLSARHWQFREVGRSGGVITTGEDGERTTVLHEDACIFLNRPGFDGDGLGCAFHHAALAHEERHLDWMPEVCWQLPLRRVDDVDDHGHVTSTVREWKRRDWGEGGHEFHWWCTDDSDAFIGSRAVYEELADELRAMVGEAPFAMIVEHLDERRRRLGDGVFLPHPALRSRSPRSGGPG